jgi:hypothetical protein
LSSTIEIVERFFLEVMLPRFNGRVQSMAVGTAYKAWCWHRGHGAVSRAMFGRLARWRKDRVGGTVWYLDCELAEGYLGLAPLAGPEALSGPGTIAKGTPTIHWRAPSISQGHAERARPAPAHSTFSATPRARSV